MSAPPDSISASFTPSETSGRMTPAEFGHHAIPVPFVEMGRTWEGWDCYGLILVFYREVYGVELPSYSGEYEGTGPRHMDRLAMLLLDGRKHWRETERRVGAVAGILRRGRCVHVGIALPARSILHCERGAGTILDRERDLNVEGFWVPAWMTDST